MIKYNLKCKNQHEFESWFSDSKEFEKLKQKKLLECIFCKSKYIDKSIMAPVIVQSTKKAEEKNSKEEFTKFKKELLNIRSFVEKNFENVGDKFSKEVRNLYYDKSKKKNIYGITTKEEREELEEEGIELASIPWIDKEN